MKIPNEQYVELVFKQREIIGKLAFNPISEQSLILWKEYDELANYLLDIESETNQLYFPPEKLYLKKNV